MRPSAWTALLLIGAGACLSACTSGSAKAVRTTEPLPTPTAAATTDAPRPSATPLVTGSPTPAVTPTRTASAAPTRPPLETAPLPGAPTCKAADLTVTDADTVVTQKTREEVFVVRTHGPDCGLQGYPTVTLKGADGKALAVTYTRDGTTPKPLSLSKGTSVSFSLSTARTGNCVEAASLGVVLPGTGAAVTASTTARACNGAVTVSPVRRLEADG